MGEALGVAAWVALLLAGFLPPILYLVWIRSFERYHREPWGHLAKAFLWGAIPAVFLAAILEIFTLGYYLAEPQPSAALLPPIIISGVIVAPVVEEFTKGLGLRWVHDGHAEAEDGFVFGAAVGLGFAATENLFYIGEALIFQGLEVAIVTGVMRAVASALLHAGASAVLGYAVWRVRFGAKGWGFILGGYALAVVIHALFNLLATYAYLASLMFAFLLALGVFWHVRNRVRELDRDGPHRTLADRHG